MSTKSNNNYDIIIVGGGPAGTTAAKFAAKNGAKVILFERDKKIGTPVRCGEGVSERGLKGYININGPSVVNKLKKAEFISPNGTIVGFESNLLGYILDRSIFDYELGLKAEKAGAEIQTESDVTELIFENSKPVGVIVKSNGKVEKYFSKIIIGADGVESRVGRWAGLNTMTKLDNMESALQIVVRNIELNSSVCQFYFGKNVAPGGYFWVFPKSNNEANIGLAISGKNVRIKSAEYYLDLFMKNNYPNATWDKKIAGGVPCNPPLKRMTIDNVLVAGDAGHQVNPLTGAGIANALQAGKIAGELAAEAINNGGAYANYIKNYDRRWKRARGRIHKSATRLKNYVINLEDKQLDDMAKVVRTLPQNEWSMLKIFLTLLRNKPELLIDAFKIFRKF